MNKLCWIFGHNYVQGSRDQESPLYSRYYSHICSRKNCRETTDYPDTKKYENTFWDSDAWTAVKIIFSILVATFSIVFLIVLLANSATSATCDAYGKMGVEVSYNFWTGCMANHAKFGWVPIADYFRVINLNVP